MPRELGALHVAFYAQKTFLINFSERYEDFPYIIRGRVFLCFETQETTKRTKVVFHRDSLAC